MINLKQLSYYKNIARIQGSSNKIILDVPPYYKYGHIAEIAMMGILGRLQTDLQKQGIRFFVESDWRDDISGISDLIINKFAVQLKSKYSYQYNLNYDYACCMVEYNIMGIVNLKHLLEYVNITCCISDETVKDINYIWKTYMTYYGIVDGDKKKVN